MPLIAKPYSLYNQAGEHLGDFQTPRLARQHAELNTLPDDDYYITYHGLNGEQLHSRSLQYAA